MQAAGRPYVMAGVALAGASLVAVTPIGSPAGLPRVSDADVRLTSTDVSDLFSGLTSALSGLDLGSLTSDLSGLGLGSLDLGSLTDPGGLFADGSILNIPYNVFADIVNIPYEESLALDEYAYALGPAGSTGGVAGWIPPGATVDNGGVDPLTDQYTLGGTGSWYMESMGNTWGWDNGNWPQVDGLIHFLLPFQWTEGITTSIQSVAQSSFIDGAYVNCEFECGDLVGYLGGWLTHLGQVLDPTYPTTLTDTIGQNFTYPDGQTIVNVGPDGTPDTAIWSGEPTINPLLTPIQAIWENATASPTSDPIMLPDLAGVFDNAVKLGQDFLNDFNPFIEGSFIYWGAPTLYSIPAAIGGLIHTATLGLVPNEFANTAIGWPANGAEPLTGYTDGPSSLLTGLPEGFQYLVQGLEGYLNPATYVENITSETSGLSTELSSLLGSAGGTLPTDLLGSFDPSTLSTDLLGSFDPSTLLAGLDPTAITGDITSLLTNAANDLGGTIGSDLALNLLTSLI